MSKTLGIFEVVLLAGIRRLGNQATGLNLRNALAIKVNREIAVGQLYLSLGKLEQRGLITHRALKATPVKGGRTKKLFMLTESGEHQLDETLAMLVDAP